MSEESKTKEIDLLDLFKLIGKGIKSILLNILKAIVFLISFGVKKIYWLVLMVIIGMALGVGYHSLSKSFYSTGMVLKTNGIQSTELIDYINDLAIVCKSGDKGAVMEALNIPDSSARNIKMIEAYPYIDADLDGRGDYVDFEGSYSPRDTTQRIDYSRCYLAIELYASERMDYLQKGLVSYINKNNYMLQMYQLRKAGLKEQILQTQNEIIKLDSLQNIEYFSDKGQDRIPVDKGGFIVYTEKDKRMYYHDKLELVKQKLTLERDYKLIQGPITVVKDLSELASEENPRLIVMIKFGFWFGIIGYLFFLIATYRRNIERFVNS